MGVITISRALNYQKRLVTEINRLKEVVRRNNSYKVGNTVQDDALKAWGRLMVLKAHLIDLKEKVDAVSMPVKPAIFELAELKDEATFLQTIPVTAGFFEEQEYEHAAGKYVKITTEHRASVSKDVVEARGLEITKRIDSLQERLDSHNHTVMIEIEFLMY